MLSLAKTTSRPGEIAAIRVLVLQPDGTRGQHHSGRSEDGKLSFLARADQQPVLVWAEGHASRRLHVSGDTRVVLGGGARIRVTVQVEATSVHVTPVLFPADREVASGAGGHFLIAPSGSREMAMGVPSPLSNKKTVWSSTPFER